MTDPDNTPTGWPWLDRTADRIRRRPVTFFLAMAAVVALLTWWGF